MSGRVGGRGGGRGRGWYYKEKYARGNSGRHGNGYSEQERYDDDYGEQQQQQQQAGAGAVWQQRGSGGPAAGRGQRGSAADLEQALRRLDGQSYKAYHDVEGAWAFPGFTFILDRAQSDPFAQPSRCRVLVPAATAKIHAELWASRIRRTALCDFLTRSFAAAVSAAGADVRTESGGWAGNKGGEICVDAPGQHVLERTSCQVDAASGALEARFTVALPARGRSILGGWAAQILVANLPRYVRQGLYYEAQDARALAAHVACVEDTQALRDALPAAGLVAFVGDGAILPRQSGASDAPMAVREAMPFRAPESLAVTLQLPNAGAVRGLGMKAGVTLIVGGGFHGKTTLLKALEAGVYDKVPGDGRELVAAVHGAVKIRAEDGRRVEATNISPFISNLPFGKDTVCFRSPDASGSTSQAANIAEALELGAACLLLDEDVCATNFMIRDARMQALVARDKEPITPFIAKIRSLAARGVSCVLVMGGAGDYFGVADCVLRMDCYAASDATAEAHAIDARFGGRSAAAGEDAAGAYGSTSDRVPVEVYPGPITERVKVTTRQTSLIQYGDENVELAAVEQLAEKSQTRAIADALNVLRQRAASPPHGGQTVAQLLASLERELDAQGLDILAPTMKAGNLARPRHFEIGAALNRLRTVKMRQK